MSISTLDVDILIIGGGVAGATCAALLARQNHRVALIDGRQPKFEPAEGEFDLRVVAISPGSQRVLAAAGAWPRLARNRLAPYRSMQVHSEGLSVKFESADHGLPELGWIVEIPALETALWESLEALDNVELLAPQRWTELEQSAETVRVRLADGSSVRAGLVVAADGARSRVRRLAALDADEWHYNQHALVGPVSTTTPNTGIAWQRFTEHGPLALLPLPDGRSSIVWSLPTEQAERFFQASDDDFVAELNRHQDSPFGAALSVGRRGTLQLVHRRARKLVKQRLVLLGDAARSVHPLAGQGLNLGLMDAAALAEVMDSEAAFETRQALARYERWRLSAGSLIGGGIHAINETVRAPGGLGRHALGAGFAVAARAWPLREAFVRHACGIDSDSPRLAREVVGWQAQGHASDPVR